MALLRLDIQSVRNIQKAIIEPSPRLNFFYGENGSGKSAVLEAIFLLGRAKSFRSPIIKSVITTNEKNLVVTVKVSQISGNSFSVGLRASDKNNVFHINHQLAGNKSNLAYVLPLQIIHPKSYELLDEGGQIRREFLDWGIFNSQKDFLLIWRRFKKILTHRNILLKQRAINQLSVWNHELASYGMQVADFRENYLKNLNPVFKKISQQFLAIDSIDLSLVPGWDNSISLLQAITNDLNKDLRYGYTHSGPHRGDFHVLIEGRLVKNFVSRGQLKILVMSLLLAQVQLLINEGGNPPCILIDDFAAELDIKHREKILNYLISMQSQVFITAIQKEDFGLLTEIENYKMFHVEHGNIIQV